MRFLAFIAMLAVALTLILNSVQIQVQATPPPIRCSVQNEFKCADGTKCIIKNHVCDGTPDCADSSDESPALGCENVVLNCTAQEFQCDNKKCILILNACDGQDDCGDESDEKYCKANDCGSHPDLFQCKNTGKCLPKYKVCNGVHTDCEDGDLSDEVDCWKPDACPKHTLACMALTSTGTVKMRCINDWHRCDAYRVCEDGLDELGCPPRFENGTYCELGELECKNHLCINMDQICDGKDHCLDGLDETPKSCDAKIQAQNLMQQQLRGN